MVVELRVIKIVLRVLRLGCLICLRGIQAEDGIYVEMELLEAIQLI